MDDLSVDADALGEDAAAIARPMGSSPQTSPTAPNGQYRGAMPNYAFKLRSNCSMSVFGIVGPLSSCQAKMIGP
jgi:hypothetical protein